ncbi:hypothetical protein PR048_000205 [Dryococelus australis]|uniref:Uncharacterized protein n=1 Tax=Dryococelus australis TaxID=614101 RepID=A0ABQ9IDZ5_9NEOP|nr:hypothetical protein PR048_000205 [Dryococelus australis]
MRRVWGSPGPRENPADLRHRSARFPLAKIGERDPTGNRARPAKVRGERYRFLVTKQQYFRKTYNKCVALQQHTRTIRRFITSSHLKQARHYTHVYMSVYNHLLHLHNQLHIPRGAVAERLYCSPPTKANRVRSSAGPLPGFPHARIVPDNATGQRVSSGISQFPPPFHSGASSYSLRFTLIGSQDLAEPAWRTKTVTAMETKLFDPYTSKAVNIHPVDRRNVRASFMCVYIYIIYIHLPPANWARFPAGLLPDFRVLESCRTMPLVGRFSPGSPVSPRPCIPALVHTHLTSTLIDSQRLDRHDGNTACLTRRSDEALWLRVSVARIAPTLLDLENAGRGQESEILGCRSKFNCANGHWIPRWQTSDVYQDGGRLPRCLTEYGRGGGGQPTNLLGYSPPHLGELSSIPDGVALGFSHVGIVPDDDADRRVSSGLSRFPPRLNSGAAPASEKAEVTVDGLYPSLAWVRKALESASRLTGYCVLRNIPYWLGSPV